jgi:hypothetical protein
MLGSSTRVRPRLSDDTEHPASDLRARIPPICRFERLMIVNLKVDEDEQIRSPGV